MTLNQYDKLFAWLDDLTDEEIRDVIRSFLGREKLRSLGKSVEHASRGDFLGIGLTQAAS
jgi:hypothetical protein